MIHTLPYQTEELLKESFFRIRKNIDPAIDTIHLTVKHSYADGVGEEEIYKNALRLEGKYRTETNTWIEPMVKVRVIKQL